MEQTTTNMLDHLHFHCPTTEQKNALLALEPFVKEDNENDFFVLGNKILFLDDVNQVPPIHDSEAKVLSQKYLRTWFGWKGTFHYCTDETPDPNFITKKSGFGYESVR